jgi:hypothetical protein
MENIGIENVVFEIRNNVKSQSCNISIFFNFIDTGSLLSKTA